MPTKVLVFESDPAFAGELRTELGRLGLVAQVVDDGYAGLMAAASDKPDLILLSIELPRMNGFSVCNKLKKDPALKDVPLIIMSSDSSDDTFEQHRKLRTRAEDYVHKPIAFGELLEHMRPFVELDNGPLGGADDAGIIIDDSELTAGLDTNGTSDDSPVQSSEEVDAEVEAFANKAFDRLLDNDTSQTDARSTEPRLGRAAPAAKSSVPPRPTVDAEVERLQRELERQKMEMARLERELGSARADVQRLEQNANTESASNEQVLRLQREIDEIRLKAASGQKIGGVSSREFLDLREALNKKDKEILGLRDQISRKEKDLLDASDSGLVLEREKADLDDKIVALEKELQSAKSFADIAKADKEQAAKRAEDFKTRGEKVKAELEAKTAELVGIQKKHDEEMAVALSELRETEQRAYAEAQETEQRAHAEAREAEQRAYAEAIAKLKEEAEYDKAAALGNRETELKQEAEQRLAAVVRSNDEEQTRLKGDLSSALEDAETAKARLVAREGELEEQRRTEIAAQKAELEALRTAQLGELETKHAKRLAEVEARAAEVSAELSTRTEERETLAREAQQLKETLDRTQADLAQARADLTGLREKLAEQAQKLETVAANWEANKASLEHAKDALAAALAQIEEAEARGV